jgi:diadenosine tetraphosphate (Ap4A) HIT family hydrolase
MQTAFALDPILARDTHHVCMLPTCEVRLMNDRRFPWLILVPRVVSASELFDLPAPLREAALGEMNMAAVALKRLTSCSKINLGMLGNIVRQLHIHVIARDEDDPAWPGPVWGFGGTVPYDETALEQWIPRLQQSLIHG